MQACNRTTLGIDPSLNSTGLCVNRNGKKKYYIITSHMTRAMQSFSHPEITYLPYEKADTNKKMHDYAAVEYNKALNVNCICECIKQVIKKHKPDIVYMEGISYGSAGSAAISDLAGLNFAIRCALLSSHVPFTIVTPGALKKFATGNGSADKDLMVHSWLMCEPQLSGVSGVKIDDLADAYFLSCEPS